MSRRLCSVVALLLAFTHSPGALAQLLGNRQRPLPSNPRSSTENKRGVPSLSRLAITVSVSTRDTKDTVELHRSIADQFARQDLCPKERLSHYSWIDKTPGRTSKSPLLSGWFGAIEKVTKTPDGWLVRVTVEPRLANGGTVVHSAEDRYIETYKLTNGSLRFVESIGPAGVNRPHVITFN
jgi:hypothetical protein